MDKKYLIVFAVAIAAAASFFFFKSQKNEKDLKAHKNQQYSRMIQAAGKSSIAGLSHMGRALNKYRKEKGSYPDTLSALYPDYITAKAFIYDIQWHYEPMGDDFYLGKTVHTNKNKLLRAAIGSDLKPIHESMLASIAKSKPIPASAGTTSVTKMSGERATLASRKNPKLVAKTETPGRSSSSPQTIGRKPGFSQKPPMSRKSTFHELEPVSIEELSEEEHFLHHVRGSVLVWKNNDGTLGFGNVQYPTSEKMTIYDQGEWVKIGHRSPNS